MIPYSGMIHILGFLFAAISVSLPAAADDWVEVGDSQGIKVLRKEIPGDPVFAYRGVGVLEAPLGKLITVSLDTRRQPEWVNRLEEARVVREITPFDKILYMKVNTPWPLKDRDFVVESKVSVAPDSKSATVEVHSVEEPSLPAQDCCVRGEMHRNVVVMTAVGDTGKTEINAEAHVDPKGSIPKWMVNLVQKTFPNKSIRGLLGQVSKPDILDFFKQPKPSVEAKPSAP